MKTLFLAITLNIVALSSPFWSLYSQEVRQPRGIVIYDPSKLGDKFGQAKIYSQMTPHGISTDIVTTDGERIKIVGGQLLSLVPFPTNSSPEEWRAVADKLGELASKYPLASKRLLDEESAARNKVETFTKIAAEEALRKQRIQAEETLRKQRIEALKAHQAKQIGRTITFSDNAGKAYTNVRLEAISPVGITISDSGEQKRVPFTEVSKEIQAFLGYDPKVAAEYTRIKEREEREQRERKELERLAAKELALREQVRQGYVGLYERFIDTSNLNYTIQDSIPLPQQKVFSVVKSMGENTIAQLAFNDLASAVANRKNWNETQMPIPFLRLASQKVEFLEPLSDYAEFDTKFVAVADGNRLFLGFENEILLELRDNQFLIGYDVLKFAQMLKTNDLATKGIVRFMFLME